MNLLLVEPGEVDGDRVVVSDRRATHLREVLGVAVGSTVRAGIVGGGIGSAQVIADDGAITLVLSTMDPAPAPMPLELVLAVPRPKVLTRTIEAIASFAVDRITLTNAWRVDKSYLSSPRLDAGALALAARFGAEQGMTTHVPPITVHHRLMELLDARWPTRGADTQRLIAHPTGTPLERALGSDGPITLAIGPEGGWIQRELDTFAERGFTQVTLGTPVLRVEAAVAAALGQIMLLRRAMER